MLIPLISIACAALAAAQSTFSPLRPPAIPLAVRSPYMSTWQQAGSDAGNGGYLAGQWPTFWAGAITGWTGLVRVDNATYIWMGAPTTTSLFVNQTAFEYTSTRSIFTLDVGGVLAMNVTFLSPVFPSDLLRASLPYSYMDVAVTSLDGSNHDVSIYTDISAEWVSGDRSAIAQWDFGIINSSSQPKSYPSPSPAVWPSEIHATTYATKTSFDVPASVTHPPPFIHAQGQGHRPHSFGKNPSAYPTAHPTSYPRPSPKSASDGIAYHEVWRQTQLAFSETDDQADFGYWYYATENSDALTYQSGTDATVRGQFADAGYLMNTNDTNYRAINDSSPVFGFAVDLGPVGSSSKSSLFQLSLHQTDAVQFLATNGNQSVASLWTSYFSDDLDAVQFFYNDYQTGSSIATTLDNQIATDSLAAGGPDSGQDYLALTSLATRQAFGSLEWANSPTEPWIFMKEISSDGNVNTVDIIFPFHPIAIYLNPSLLKYLLDPLFINQEAGNWPFAFSIHDIGTAFPNATGHADGDAEQQPLEECGNMLIMTLAYAQRANDNAYLAQHYALLKQWTGYLVNDSLIPQNQISTDDFAGSLANQTNLALKGIVGIEAFAQIANRTGNAVDTANYTAIAHSYIEQWQGLGIAHDAVPPHATLAYGMNATHGLLYNLFGDRELGLGLVPQAVYDMQSAFYPTVLNTYGVPLDTRHNYTKTDWEIFAASVASQSTRDEFVETVAKWLGETPTNFAFTDLYDTISGDYPVNITFIARPAVGGVFALLALDSAPSSGYVAPAVRRDMGDLRAGGARKQLDASWNAA